MRRRTTDPGARWRNQRATILQNARRVAQLPELFIVWYVGLDSQDNRILVSQHSMALLGQHMGGPSATHAGEAANLNDVRARNPNIMLMAYLQVAHATDTAISPGIGNDLINTLGDTAWLLDGNGDPYFITWDSVDYNLYDYRNANWRTAFLAAADAILAQYPWDGLFLDNCTALWSAHQAVNHGALDTALNRMLTELRRRHPQVFMIGNCIERWPALNGKMVEGRRADWPDELVPPFGYQPRMDLALEFGYADQNDPDIEIDLDIIRSYDAWFGVMGGTPTAATHLPWPPAFQNYVEIFGTEAANTYNQTRVDTGGLWYLNHSGILTGIASGQTLTFSGWFSFNNTARFDQRQVLMWMHCTATRDVFTVFMDEATHELCMAGANTDPDLLSGFVHRTGLIVTHTDLHYIKVQIDITGNVVTTLDGASDTTAFNPDIGPFQFEFEFGTSAGAGVRIGADPDGRNQFDGSWGDVVFDDSALNHSSLAWNNGVPLDIAGVSAKIKIYKASATAHAAGTANAYGTGGTFTQVSVTAAHYAQRRVHNSGTRYLTHSGVLTGITNSAAATFSGWFSFDSSGFSNQQDLLRLYRSGNASVFAIYKAATTNRLMVESINVSEATGFTWDTGITLTAIAWHYIKVTANLTTDIITAVVDTTSVSESISQMGAFLSFEFAMAGGAGCNIGADSAGNNVFNGGMADVVFADSVLTDSALAYNGGVPLNIDAIAAEIKITRQLAAAFAAGTANVNGTGGSFTQAGSGAWKYAQARVANAGTRYLTHEGPIDGSISAPGPDLAKLTFAAWVILDQLGVRHPLITDIQTQIGGGGTIQSLGVEINASNQLSFMHRNDTLGNQLGPVTTAATVTATGLHFCKVVLDYIADTLDLTLDGTTESWVASEISNTGFHNTVNLVRQRIGAMWETTPSAILNGALCDLVYDESVLTDPALAYNGGVPLDPTHIEARVNISGQDAAAFAAGRANDNGGSIIPKSSTAAGKQLTSAGSGSWTNV